MTKDYYKILGVQEFESAENIKLAYRKLVRKYHPDIVGNTSENLIRFKEINEAYEVLSNHTQKAEYDRARSFYNYAKGVKKEKEINKEYTTNPDSQANNHKSNSKSGFNFNWDSIFKKQANSKEIKKPQRGEDIYSDVEISVLEAVSGTTKTINMLKTKLCPKCNGRKFVNGTQCPHCHGKGELTNYKKFTVKIPAGIKNGSKIRLAGEGEEGLYGGSCGDLYLIIHINEPQNYKAEGLNILKTLTIAPHEAVLGTEIKVSTPRGDVKVKITPNTKNGQKIRLANCGLVQNDKIGDMIVYVEVQIPQNLSKEEINLYKKLAEISTSNIRDN